MKNKLASTVIALVLCTFFSFGNTTIAFANSTDHAVDSIEETECTDCLTDKEYHDYQMWLLETEEHMDESKLYSNGISTYSNDLDYSYSGSCGDDVTYSYNMETKILSIGGDGKMWDFMFNDVHTSVPWSEYRSEIEGVEIGANVTYIGSGAFSYLTALTYVSIPSTVSEIGMYSFANCINLTSVSVHSQYINQCAFQSCRSLTTIDLNGVKTISWRAFGACNALTSVDISDSVSEIWQPFYNCMSIESVNVSENNSYFASVDGVLYDKDLTVLYYYPANKSGSSYTIPDSITRVSSYAFAYNKNLHEINFPSECRLDEYVLQDSNYIEHWAEYDSDYRYYYGGAYYLVVNGVLLDVKNVDGSTITMLDFSNIIYRDGSSRWVTKVDLQKPDNFSNVISVLGTELIDIQHNCLSETAWFKNSDVNVIYDNPDPEQATFKLLYSYRGSSNLVHAETYTHIGASAFSEWESDSETGLTIYLSSENTTIDDEMLCTWFIRYV